MTLILSDKDVRGLGDMSSLVELLGSGLRAEAETTAVVPARVNLDHGESMLRVMPAILPGAGILGLKFFHGTLSGGIRYSVIVSDLASGEVLACVDAAYLTALRTGATSGVATRHLARADAARVGLIGSGLEAETNLAAVCAVRPISEVKVYSRNPENRADFAVRMAPRLDAEIVPVASPEAAVTGADIVVVATNTGRGGAPAFHGSCLEAGQHVVSIGSTAPFLRELDAEAFTRPDVVVFDVAHDAMVHESGDLSAVADVSPEWRPAGTLADLLADRVGRDDDAQVTLFKSVGSAAQDLIAAEAIYRLACDQGVGLVVPDLSEPKTF